MERVRKGMSVRSTSGISLGKVISYGPRYFMIEKGMFFPKDHELENDGIVDIRGEEIVYELARAAKAEPTGGWAGGGPLPDKLAESEAATRLEVDELRVPLMEEEVIVEKSLRETGSVRLHKKVITEQKQVTVPLKHEEIIVEHLPAIQATPGSSITHPFEDERIALPLHDEDFTIVKRPHVKEEVRVRRVTHEEQRSAEATVRHEELEVEGDTRGGASSREFDKTDFDKKEL